MSTAAASPSWSSPGAQPEHRPALLMHYVIFRCTCSQGLKFHRAVLLIEAISARDISTTTSEDWRHARQGFLSLYASPHPPPYRHPLPRGSPSSALIATPSSLSCLSHLPSGALEHPLLFPAAIRPSSPTHPHMGRQSAVVAACCMELQVPQDACNSQAGSGSLVRVEGRKETHSITSSFLLYAPLGFQGNRVRGEPYVESVRK